MVKIRKIPILEHIINHYVKYGFKDFYSSYKAEYNQNYFKKKRLNINVIDTGQKTMTGGRLKD